MYGPHTNEQLVGKDFVFALNTDQHVVVRPQEKPGPFNKMTNVKIRMCRPSRAGENSTSLPPSLVQSSPKRSDFSLLNITNTHDMREAECFGDLCFLKVTLSS